MAQIRATPTRCSKKLPCLCQQRALLRFRSSLRIFGIPGSISFQFPIKQSSKIDKRSSSREEGVFVGVVVELISFQEERERERGREGERERTVSSSPVCGKPKTSFAFSKRKILVLFPLLTRNEKFLCLLVSFCEREKFLRLFFFSVSLSFFSLQDEFLLFFIYLFR